MPLLPDECSTEDGDSLNTELSISDEMVDELMTSSNVNAASSICSNESKSEGCGSEYNRFDAGIRPAMSWCLEFSLANM